MTVQYNCLLYIYQQNKGFFEQFLNYKLIKNRLVHEPYPAGMRGVIKVITI